MGMETIENTNTGSLIDGISRRFNGLKSLEKNKPAIPHDVTPTDTLGMIGKMLNNVALPMPAGQVLALAHSLRVPDVTGGLAPNFQSQANDYVVSLVRPYLLDDAQLDKSEIAQIIAGLGNKFNGHEPDSLYVDQARDMLQQNGITDESGSIAKGLAQAAISMSINLQYAEYSYMPKIGIEKIEPLPQDEGNPYKIPETRFPAIPIQ